MAKLRLYGKKRLFFGLKRKGFVAEILVRNGTVEVKAHDRRLRRELKNEIGRKIQRGSVSLNRSIVETENGKKTHWRLAEPKKPGDPEFLQALREESAFWNTKTFAGYRISWVKSQIIED